VFAGSARYAEAVRRAASAKVEMIWELDSGGLGKLAATGKQVAPEEVAKRRGAVTSASAATIVYTSGTTGRPKGCVITHGNLTEAMRVTLSAPGVRQRVTAGEASSLFFLPLSHILARVVALCLVREGKRVGYLASPNDLADALPAFRPTILLAVPRVLETVADAARQRAAAEGRGRVFAAAEQTAIAWSRAGHRAPGCGCGTRSTTVLSTRGCAVPWAVRRNG
jgi:long-chain acyl-CoA synthetase